MNREAENDALLMGRIVNGDSDAARVLVERYTPALRGFIKQTGLRTDDVDDVLQETWLRVVRSAARYDPLQPFPRWLFAIAMNRVRGRWAVQSTEPLESRDVATDVASADVAIEAAQRAETVRSVIATLPEHLADTILLRFFEELSEREIAQRLDVPVGTVKSRLHHGIRRLRTALERILHA